jgi:hypothetical protein
MNQFLDRFERSPCGASACYKFVHPHLAKVRQGRTFLKKKKKKTALSLRARELDLLPRNYENCEGIDAKAGRLKRWLKEGVA